MLGGTILGFPWTNSQKTFLLQFDETLRSERRNSNPKIDLIYALLITKVFKIQLNLIRGQYFYQLVLSLGYWIIISNLDFSTAFKIVFHRFWRSIRNSCILSSWQIARPKIRKIQIIPKLQELSELLDSEFIVNLKTKTSTY